MTRKPDWLKISLPQGKEYLNVKDVIARKKLHTICVSGKCPNMSECWGRGTATFMILGDICTRACRFCSVKTGSPQGIVDWGEPDRLAESIRNMELKHVVLTSVDRDDLPDGGADFWAKTVKRVKELNPELTIETLIPDFNGIEEHINLVIDSGPNIVSHNMETVRRLTPKIRSRAKYDTSLRTIETIAKSGKAKPKSGIMVGLGEYEEEVIQTMDDLISVGCRVLTIGQYLQPTKKHLTVKEFIKPLQFQKYKEIGLEKGFQFVESGPLVRSSYHAERHI
ncbi:MAG: lipoyl synthase [Fermentimonas sp.]|nr:lipoyl synthase [Fermentimonas sp.]MDD3188645.1 lipoyl synthase [Fermentimonas sp.]MDD3511301.1 lipoyl synthase [Fermentimonas sp.]MDD4283662.1 lipoyl synthase [Fermentimonas sp.]MDD4723953.1 lipoyl synthase [Fermentimonas sp.]